MGRAISPETVCYVRSRSRSGNLYGLSFWQRGRMRTAKIKWPSKKQLVNCSFPNIVSKDVILSSWMPVKILFNLILNALKYICFLPTQFFRHPSAWHCGPGRATKSREKSRKLLGSCSQKRDLGKLCKETLAVSLNISVCVGRAYETFWQGPNPFSVPLSPAFISY